jgi:2-octaprenyl-6-methoxyphenol hydroxylase
MRAAGIDRPLALIDVLIRGAGPVGCTLALALRASALQVRLFDRAAAAAPFRPIALSHGSRLIFERLGLWHGIETTPIETIVVTQAGGFGRTELRARDAGVPALGYVIDYASLTAALRAAVAHLLVDEPLEARCTVHAEGSAADAVEKRYGQHALVALIDTKPQATASAFERFAPEGPLALLPLRGSYALIWTTSPARAQALAASDEETFLRALADAAGTKPGRPIGVRSRSVHPLVLRVRAAHPAPREVYIGNAAQTLHPVAGQGLNLGLRDAWELAREFLHAPDPGAGATLARYAARRRLDATATIRVTDWLAGGFLGANSFSRAARGVALTALDLFPGPRRFFARRMIFGRSGLP